MAVVRGNSRLSPSSRFTARALVKNIKSDFKMPKLPKYEGECLLWVRVINRSATEPISRPSFGVSGVKALLILENQIFLGHVHILFTRASLSSPAAGLRLEIVPNIDKKKSELYFYFSVKKFLTKKQNARVPNQQNLRCILSQSGPRPSPFSLLPAAGNVRLRL